MSELSMGLTEGSDETASQQNIAFPRVIPNKLLWEMCDFKSVFWGTPNLEYALLVRLFSLLNNVLLCGHTPICLSILSLMKIYMVSMFKKILNTLMDDFVCTHGQVSLGIPPKYNCQVTSFIILNFWRNYEVTVKKRCSICFPVNSQIINFNFLTLHFVILGTDFC